MNGRVVALVLRLLLGGLLIYASHDKLLDPQPFANAIDNYQILPRIAINAFAVVLPWIEMLTAACLITGVFAAGASLVAFGMFFAFTAALVSAVLRGLNIECGCFNLATETEKVSWLAAGGRALLVLASLQIMLSSLRTDWPAAWLLRQRAGRG